MGWGGGGGGGGGVNLILPVVFRKMYLLKRVKSWFFVTFNIIISHFFPENFIKISQFVQKMFFFLSGFSFMDIYESQDGRGRGRAFL